MRPRFSQALANRGCRISGQPFPVLESEGVFSFSAFCNASAGNASDKIPASSFQSASSSSRTQDATAGGVAPALLPAVTLSPAATFLLGLVARHYNCTPARMLAGLVAERAEQRGLPYWPDESGMLLVLLAADAGRDEADLAAEIIAEEADAIGLSPLLAKHFEAGDSE